MTISEKLQALQADVDVFDGATEHTPLAMLPDWGSLAVLLVILHCETRYGSVVTGPQVRGCKTVGDLLKLFPKRL